MQSEERAKITRDFIHLASCKYLVYSSLTLLVPIFICYFYLAFFTKPGKFTDYVPLLATGVTYLVICMTDFKLALYILIFFIPLQFKGVNTEYAVLSVTDIMLAELTTVWCLQKLAKGCRLFFGTDIFLLIAWILITAVSLANSIDVIRSVRLFLRLISSITLFLIIYNQMRKVPDVINMVKALVWSSLFVSAYGLLEYFWLKKDIPLLVDGVFNNYKRILTFFNQPNVTAAYLATIIPLAVFLIIRENKKSTRWFYRGCWTLNTVALGLTFSRSGWLCFAVTSFFLPMRRRIKFVLAGVIVGGILLTGFIANLSARPKSIPRRLSIYESAIPHILEKPLLGHGLNTTPHLRLIEKTYRSGETVGITAHNLYLAVLLETGLLGLLGFCLFVIKLLTGVIKPLMRIKQYQLKYPDIYTLNRCLLSSAAALLLISLFQTGLTQLLMWTVFGILSVFPVVLTQTEDKTRSSESL